MNGQVLQPLQRALAAGKDGAVLLRGIHGAGERFVVAARLRWDDADERAGFTVFARYLLQVRFACDGYGLWLPALWEGVDCYLCALHDRGQGQRFHRIDLAGPAVLDLAAGATRFPELLHPAGALPGVLRRHFDTLFAELQLDPAAQPAG